jgi:hypothetical protein
MNTVYIQYIRIQAKKTAGKKILTTAYRRAGTQRRQSTRPFSCCPNWDPQPTGECVPPSFLWGGHTWREREWRGGDPNSDEPSGEIHCGTLGIYVLCGRKEQERLERGGPCRQLKLKQMWTQGVQEWAFLGWLVGLLEPVHEFLSCLLLL